MAKSYTELNLKIQNNNENYGKSPKQEWLVGSKKV